MFLCSCHQKEKLMANAVRFLSAGMIEKAKSGHPGMPLGIADVATMLFSKHIKIDPQNPKWFDRDRFVLSGGHASSMLYSLLYLLGYKDITLGNLVIGGSSLETHLSNAQTDSANYTYFTNTTGEWESTDSYKISTAINSEDWDYITMRYDAIEEKLSTYQFTDEELKEIGRMKGKCLGYMTQQSINNLEEEIRIFSKELEGGIEGFLEIFNNSNNE